ncbi:hypothetical protein KAU33_11415, partial [Candidatus Dependentiae bacterium]|nr:hypothetical protein [Candidatus Dependentiae bacterium]
VTWSDPNVVDLRDKTTFVGISNENMPSREVYDQLAVPIPVKARDWSKIPPIVDFTEKSIPKELLEKLWELGYLARNEVPVIDDMYSFLKGLGIGIAYDNLMAALPNLKYVTEPYMKAKSYNDSMKKVENYMENDLLPIIQAGADGDIEAYNEKASDIWYKTLKTFSTSTTGVTGGWTDSALKLLFIFIDVNGNLKQGELNVN